MSHAPIVLFVYNRQVHTEKTVLALKKNNLAEYSDLYIFSDGAKNDNHSEDVEQVREYIKTIEGFKSITIEESPVNKGLANSIIYGVSKVMDMHGCVIVLEDDMVPESQFLSFMNEGLDFYKDSANIWSLTGGSFPIFIPKNYKNDVYLFYRGCSWGWATWSDRWTLVDWDVSDFNEFVNDKKQVALFNRGGHDLTDMLVGQRIGDVDSWLIRWCYAQFKNDKYTVYPIIPLVNHIGFDGSGTHSHSIKLVRETKKISVYIEKKINFALDLSLNKEIVESFQSFYGSKRKFAFISVLRKLRLYYLARYIHRCIRKVLNI